MEASSMDTTMLWTWKSHLYYFSYIFSLLSFVSEYKYEVMVARPEWPTEMAMSHPHPSHGTESSKGPFSLQMISTGSHLRPVFRDVMDPAYQLSRLVSILGWLLVGLKLATHLQMLWELIEFLGLYWQKCSQSVSEGTDLNRDELEWNRKDMESL